jgi:hypothetical protein
MKAEGPLPAGILDTWWSRNRTGRVQTYKAALEQMYHAFRHCELLTFNPSKKMQIPIYATSSGCQTCTDGFSTERDSMTEVDITE